MKIAMIGAGNVGSALGAGWGRAGHIVTYGVRRPEAAEVRRVVSESGPSARAATVREAAQASDIVTFATPWPALQEAVQSAGDLAGKVVLDCTNPLLPDLSGLDTGLNTSGGERVAQWATGAKVVKIFNTTGDNNMRNPVFGSERVTMFYCGDDPGAKQTAAQLAADLGFEPLDCGPLSQARLLEPAALLWITLALKYGLGRDIGYKLMRR